MCVWGILIRNFSKSRLPPLNPQWPSVYPQAGQQFPGSFPMAVIKPGGLAGTLRPLDTPSENGSHNWSLRHLWPPKKSILFGRGQGLHRKHRFPTQCEPKHLWNWPNSRLEIPQFGAVAKLGEGWERGLRELKRPIDSLGGDFGSDQNCTPPQRAV